MKNSKPDGYWAKKAFKQQNRFERLYGPGEYKTIITQNMKHSRLLIVGLGIFVLLILVLQFFKVNSGSKGIDLDKNGNLISIQRPASGSETVYVEAEVIADSGNHLTKQGITLAILPLQTLQKQQNSKSPKSIANNDELTANEIRKTVYQINNSTAQNVISLPTKLSDGTKIKWVVAQTYNPTLILFIMIIAGYYIYRNQDMKLIRIEKEARESVLREMPEFVNKLVLLLNAGLVLSSAFYKIVSEYTKIKGDDSNYFYDQLVRIMMKCSETNESVQHEIRIFAVRTGVVEFMRLSNIINDSMTKGTDLVTQLQLEGDNLWIARRKQMEEKGKIAETKLTFPMVILLLVLVMITIAPAMMEM